MLNTLASGRSVLVGTVLEFIHRFCFLDSIFRGDLGGRWRRLRMFRLIFLCLVLRLEPVLICLAIVAALLLVNFVGPLAICGLRSCAFGVRLLAQQRGFVGSNIR